MKEVVLRNYVIKLLKPTGSNTLVFLLKRSFELSTGSASTWTTATSFYRIRTCDIASTKHTSGTKIQKIEFSRLPHVCNTLMLRGLNLCPKVSTFQRWVLIVHSSSRKLMNVTDFKNEQNVKKQRFFTFYSNNSWFILAACHLCMHILNRLWLHIWSAQKHSKEILQV